MNRLSRVAITSRVFGIAAVLGLSLALMNTVALQATIILGGISATALAADLSSRLPQSWVAVAEGSLAALLVALVLPNGFVLLPYLVVPALIAGIAGGFRPVFVVVATEAGAHILLLMTAGGTRAVGSASELFAPWLLTSLGVGLLGGWLRRLGLGPLTPGRDESYESARRLLAQLRTVARRLSAGLDPVSMSSQLLNYIHERLGDTRSALFVRTDGGVLAPLNYRGIGAREHLRPDGRLVDDCWLECEPVHAVQPSGATGCSHRVVLPIRVASRMIGVVVAETSEAPTSETLSSMMRHVDEQSLRLDTAMVFDEVRSLATMEERQRLAREIHDGVAQEVASLGYVVDDLAASAASVEQRHKLLELRTELSRVVSELRLSIFDLRSEVNPSAGLGSALSDYVREVGARSGMTVHLTLDESPTRLRSEVETELLRIAQEAITNARKHAAARNLWVDCRIRPPFARIHVLDDGNGLGSPRSDSFGLRIMRERANRISASLEVTDRGGHESPLGTSVTVTVGATT